MRKVAGALVLTLAAVLLLWALLWAGGVMRTDGDADETAPVRGAASAVTVDDGSADADESESATRRHVDLAVARGAAIGLVTEPDGSPAAGVEVVAFVNRDPALRAAEARTDAEGRFVLAQLVGYDIVALRPGSSCSAWASVEDESHDVALTLGRGAIATGSVRFEKGGVAPDVSIELQFAAGASPPHWRTRTNAKGGYALGGVPSGWWMRPCIQYSASRGPAGMEYGPFTLPTPTSFVREGAAHIAGDEGDVFVRDLVARYFPAAPVTFRLEFPDGVTPPGDLLVETWDADGSGHSSGPETVDPTSPEFMRALDLGEALVVYVRAGSYAGETGVLSFDTEDPRTVTIEMQPAPRLVGRLLHADGRPAALAGVDVLVGVWRDDSGSGAEMATTDAEGRADLTWQVPFPSILDDPAVSVAFVVEGQGVVSALLLGDAPNVLIPGPELAARLRSGADPVILDIPLITPKQLVVTAVDVDGAPVAGVVLATLSGGPLWPGRVTTDDEGRATFDIVVEHAGPNEWVVIESEAPWRGTLNNGHGIGDNELLADGGEVEVTVRLVEKHRVRVVDQSGAPIASAGVRIREARHVTDADGWVTVDGVPGDSVQLSLPGHLTTTTRLPDDGPVATLVAVPLRTVAVHVVIDDPDWRGSLRCEARTENAVFRGRELDVASSEEPSTTLTLPFAPATVRLTSTSGLWSGHGEIDGDDTDVTVRLRPTPLHPVRLRIVDEDGNPMPATRVEIGSRRLRRAVADELVTDVDGEVRLELPAGKSRSIELRVQGGPWDTVSVDVPSARPVEVSVMSESE